MQISNTACILLSLIIAWAINGCSSGTGDTGSIVSDKVLSAAATKGSLQGHAGGFVDIDGDGIDDMVVTAPYANSPSGLGVALVYKGAANGFSTGPVQLLNGGTNFGYDFVTLGDVNGDGKADYAVSALNGSSDAVSLSGNIRVFKGASNGQLFATISGETALDKFGYDLAAGDLNNDGIKEIIVGAPFNTPNGRPDLYQGGAVYVYDFTAKQLNKLPATSIHKGLGWKVAAGDINGDGIDDLAFTAAGKVLVYYGKSGFSPATDSPDVTISSSAAGFGSTVSVVGDIDGDGYKDVAISTIYSYGTGICTVHIVKGGTGSRLINLNAATSDVLTQINGESTLDAFGTTIIPVGDMENDGKEDFVVSAVHADNDSFKATGRVYLFKGKDITSPTTPITAASMFKGNAKDMHFGRFMAAFSKNGPKLLIGAPTENANTGGVYGVSLDGGQPVFQASSGGTTTTGENCCKVIAKGGR